jgi:hypothetical protein
VRHRSPSLRSFGNKSGNYFHTKSSLIIKALIKGPNFLYLSPSHCSHHNTIKSLIDTMFLSATLLFIIISPVILTSSATGTDLLPSAAAVYHLSKVNSCTDHGKVFQSLPATCVPILDTGYKILRVTTWPLCANGNEALLAFYWPGSKNCDGRNGNFNSYVSKNQGLNACLGLQVTGSFNFFCPGKPPTPPTREEAQGGVVKYPRKGCDKSSKPRTEMHSPDTCIDIDEGLGLSFSRGATCRNGTKAAAAGFKGKGCDPTDSPLERPFTVWDDIIIGMCLPTDDIRSIAFWCDGFDGLDMTKPRKKSGRESNLGFILGLTLGLGGGILTVIGGLFVSYKINLRFRSWVQVSSFFASAIGTKQANCFLGTTWWWGWIYCFMSRGYL